MTYSKDSRPEEERMLEMFRMHCAGFSLTTIGEYFGISASLARTKIQHIRTSCADESGEDISGAYWP